MSINIFLVLILVQLLVITPNPGVAIGYGVESHGSTYNQPGGLVQHGLVHDVAHISLLHPGFADGTTLCTALGGTCSTIGSCFYARPLFCNLTTTCCGSTKLLLLGLLQSQKKQSGNYGHNTGHNIGYGHNTGHNTGYGHNTGHNTGYGHNTGHGTGYGHNTGHNTGYGHNTGHNTDYGHNTGHDTGYGHNTDHNTGYGHDTGYGHNTGHNTGYGHDTGHDTGYGHNTGHNTDYGHNTGHNTGYGHNTGHDTGYGHNTDHNTGYGHNTGHNTGYGHNTANVHKTSHNIGYDHNTGYGLSTGYGHPLNYFLGGILNNPSALVSTFQQLLALFSTGTLSNIGLGHGILGSHGTYGHAITDEAGYTLGQSYAH